MKILKNIGKDLELKAKRNIKISIILLAIGIVGIFHTYISNNFILIFPYVIILSVATLFFKKHSDYLKGLEGEKMVINELSKLDDRYYLINDVKFSDSYGNIDHIVLGPNGIFVVETKNWKKYWKRYIDFRMATKPSKQAKGNALKVNQIIKSSNIFKKQLNAWIQGTVVFVNPNIDLDLTDKSVPVLKINELYDYIKNKKSEIRFSNQDLEKIGKVILNQIESD